MSNLRSVTLYDIYEKNAAIYGANPAFNWQGKDTSYADLYAETSKLARGLEELKLSPGSRVAVLSLNHSCFFHLFGAAAALNLVLVLINRRLSLDEIEYIIEDTGSEVVISDKDYAKQASDIANKHDSLKHCFVIDSDDPQNDLSQLYNSQSLEKTAVAKMTDPYMIIHTAAVMGKPRGATLNHENILLSNEQISQVFNLDSSKTHLNILPLFHIMGVNLALATLQVGGKNVILEKFNPEQSLKLIEKERVNIFGSFPPILNNIMDATEKGDYNLSSMEAVVGLEVPDNAKRWEDLSGAKFWTMYGQTETSGLITFAPYFEKSGSAGKISPLVNLQILDEYDKVLPAGETGEIAIRGPLVFNGYWNEDDLNKHTFREGWHHTGDLGMLDSEGYLFFKGRKAEKELIKPGGENVFPAEVEKVILEHEAVNEVCVFGVPDPKFGEGIKAVCSLHKGHELTAKELIDFTASNIARYKKPRYVEFIDELPKTADGAIDREKVKSDFA